MNDLKADASIALNQLESSTRFQQDLATLSDVQSKWPPSDGWDYYGFGHSLGGAILDVFLNKKMLKSGLSYNPAIQPKDFTNTGLPNDRVFAENDPLWMLAKPFLQKKPDVRAAKRSIANKMASWIPYVGTAYDKLQGHRLSQFEGGMWHPLDGGSKSKSKAKTKFQTSPLLEIKPFPQSYSKDAVEILKQMSFGPDLKLLGSMSLRSQLYAGDYDGFEVVKTKGSLPAALHSLRTTLQSNIKALMKMNNVFIGDIKAGSVERWRLLPQSMKIIGPNVVGWDYAQAMAKLHAMKESGVLSDEEAREAASVLKPVMRPSDFFDARAVCKFHVLRWTPADVAKNSLKLRDGSSITLEEAFQCPSIAKLDVIGWVQNNRFTDFSVIYEFHHGSHILNHDPIDIEDSLRADVTYYRAKGKYYKSLKREFALAKVVGDLKTINRLSPILNSDLGRLYVVYGDIGTLTNLLKMPHVSIDNIRFELDQFIQRLSNVYGLDEFLRSEPTIRREIHRIGKLSRSGMIEPLKALEEKLATILQAGTLKAVSKTAVGREDTGVTDAAAAERLDIAGAGRCCLRGGSGWEEVLTSTITYLFDHVTRQLSNRPSIPEGLATELFYSKTRWINAGIEALRIKNPILYKPREAKKEIDLRKCVNDAKTDIKRILSKYNLRTLFPLPKSREGEERLFAYGRSRERLCGGVTIHDKLEKEMMNIYAPLVSHYMDTQPRIAAELRESFAKHLAIGHHSLVNVAHLRGASLQAEETACIRSSIQRANNAIQQILAPLLAAAAAAARPIDPAGRP
tara:strand:- start:2202 stop:4586 length:2385 start_codon:yes stop_codon:yes gene_type:complete